MPTFDIFRVKRAILFKKIFSEVCPVFKLYLFSIK